MRVYGPYTRVDGRKHVILISEDGKRITKSYPRYLLEIHIGRELADDETVDHINEDKTDDRIENLQILSRIDNATKSYALRGKPKEMFDFVCPQCNTHSSKPLRDVKHARKQGKAGPFCSKSCAGKASNN